MAGDVLADARTGKDGRHALVGLLRQSVFGRLTRPENLAALADLSGRWIDRVHRWRPPKLMVLDIDASESPIYGEQEGSAYSGHFGGMCYHPLFLFNQFGDLERCALRSGARDRRSASECQGKWPDQPPLPPLAMPEAPALVCCSRLASAKADKARIVKPDRVSSGEFRLKWLKLRSSVGLTSARPTVRR